MSKVRRNLRNCKQYEFVGSRWVSMEVGKNWLENNFWQKLARIWIASEKAVATETPR